MSEYDMIENIAGENTAAREHGTSVAREYERVVNTFNKVLLFKEKIRLSFEYRINELDNDLTRIENQLGTLLRNIEIYELNISRSSINLQQLLLEETHTKETYNSLLQGTSIEPKEVLSVVEELVDEKKIHGSQTSMENLIQQRHDFLENLNSSFQKLDNDLQSINSNQTEMLNARSEILDKKQQALEKKIILEENKRDLEDERKMLTTDLEISNKEEEVLTLEYAELINKVEGCIVLGSDIDRILFSALTTFDD
jgi:chromosome segregation ATPase